MRIRLVFWLRIFLLSTPFPVSQWLTVDFVPVTAAGPLPISTGFPFKLSHLIAYEIVCQKLP